MTSIQPIIHSLWEIDEVTRIGMLCKDKYTFNKVEVRPWGSYSLEVQNKNNEMCSFQGVFGRNIPPLDAFAYTLYCIKRQGGNFEGLRTFLGEEFEFINNILE